MPVSTRSATKLITLALLTASYLVVWLFAVPGLVRVWITHEAAQRGAELRVDEVDLGVRALTLRGVQLGFDDADSAVLESEEVVFDFGDPEGLRVRAERAALVAETPQDAMAWAQHALGPHGRAALGALHVDQLTLDVAGERSLQGELEVDDVEARFTMDPTRLDELAPILGLPSNTGGTVSGSLSLLPSDRGPLAHVDLTVRGLEDYPRELDGLVGRHVRIQADVELSSDEDVAVLRDLSVTSGAVALTGDGELWSEDGRVALSASLRGAVACTELSASALSAHLGPLAAGFASAMIRQHVTGQIGVSLQVEHRPEDARRAPNRTAALRAPVMATDVSVGCGLRL